MTIEQAIEKLCKRAEYAQSMANTPGRVSKAHEYIEEVNTVIDYFNNTEHHKQLFDKVVGLIFIFAECLGLSEEQVNELKDIPPSFIRNTLLKHIDNGGCPQDLFRIVISNYKIIQNAQKSIEDMRENMSLLKYMDDTKLLEQYNKLIDEDLDLIMKLTTY